MFIAIILATFSLFTVVFNVITIAWILRKKVAPYYFKVKLSLVLNTVWCAAFGWLVFKSNNTKDLIFMIILLLLSIWYTVILLGRPSKNA